MSRSRSKAPQFFADSPQTAKLSSVSGGFRAGKRKRGVSLLRKTPKAQAHANTLLVSDEVQKVGEIRTVAYKRAKP